MAAGLERFGAVDFGAPPVGTGEAAEAVETVQRVAFSPDSAYGAFLRSSRDLATFRFEVLAGGVEARVVDAFPAGTEVSGSPSRAATRQVSSGRFLCRSRFWPWRRRGFARFSGGETRRPGARRSAPGKPPTPRARSCPSPSKRFFSSSVDAHVLITGHADGSAAVWNLASSLRMATLAGHADAVTQIAHAPETSTPFQLVSASLDGTLKVSSAIYFLCRISQDAAPLTFRRCGTFPPRTPWTWRRRRGCRGPFAPSRGRRAEA
jgi:WD40 repeat protein